MRLVTCLAAFLCAFAALAVGPQDLTVTFQTRAGGGTVQGHRLYVNDELVGTVQSGQAVSGAIPGNGTYKVCVNAFNATGETEGGQCKTAALVDAAPAPTDVIDVKFACESAQGQVGTCTVTFTPQP